MGGGHDQSEWLDACHGHTEMYKAIECHESAVALFAGKLPPTTLKDLVTLALVHQARGLGIKFEHRIVKRTFSDEVLETNPAVPL